MNENTPSLGSPTALSFDPLAAQANGHLADSSPAEWRTPVRGAPRRDERPYRVAKALGWLSLAIGLAELLAPRSVARAAGVASPPLMTRALGVRELMAGVTLLQAARPQPGVWMRVAGDAMDVAAVAGLARSRQRAGWALGVLGVIALVDVACAAALERERRSLVGRRDWDYADRGGLRRVK